MSTYSAGMMSVPFLFIETQNTARLLTEGLSVTEAKEEVLRNNVYQMQSVYRAKQVQQWRGSANFAQPDEKWAPN